MDSLLDKLGVGSRRFFEMAHARLFPARLQFKVETWRLEEQPSPEVLRLEGWCFANRRREPVTLRLLADGHAVADIPCQLERPDVTRSFAAGGSSREVPACGFDARIRVPPDASILRLETIPEHHVLAESRIEELRAMSLRFGLEAFDLDPFGASACLHLEGWCLLPGRPEPISLRLLADGGVLEEIACELERPDVGRFFAGDRELDSAPLCGFSARVPIPAEARLLRLEAVTEPRLLAEKTIEVLRATALRFAMETFEIEPSGIPERLHVEGWCFVPGQAEPVALRLLADDRILQEIMCRGPRGDVARTFGAEGEFLCGFAARVSIPEDAGVLRLETVQNRRVLAERALDILRSGALRFELEAFGLVPFGASERLRIEGWCYACGQQQPARLLLTADGLPLRSIRCGRRRDDVAGNCGRRERPGSTSLPHCGFRAHVVVPAEAEIIRLETSDRKTILAERKVESIAAYRAAVETFRVEPPPLAGTEPLLLIEGWMYPRAATEAVHVTLYADHILACTIDCDIERRDVEQAFLHLERPGATPLPRCGFRARLRVPVAEVLELKAPDGTVIAARNRSTLGPSSAFVSSLQTRWAAHVENNTLRPHVKEMLLPAVRGFSRLPTFAVLVTVRNEGDLTRLGDTLGSLYEQIYRHWELSIAVPEGLRERTREAIAATPDGMGRVWIVGGHVGDAGRATTGQWLCVLDAGDRLVPHALFEVAWALQGCDADLLYGDEDVLDEDGACRDPSFKPAWSPTRLLSHNYVGRPAFVRRAVHDAGGGFGDGEHALWLRLRDTAVVRRLPRILCHRVPGSQPDPVPVVAAHLDRGRPRLSASPGLGGVAVVEGAEAGPEVEIVIPTHNQAHLLRRCLRSLEQTRYRPFHITVVDDRSDDPETLALLQEARARGVKVLRLDDSLGFSFARLNNRAVEDGDAELVLLLNNDTEIRDPRWLSRMVALLGPGVGAVGARLLYPDGTLQHAGVHLWVNGLAPGHELTGWPADIPSPGARAEAAREVVAVTGACLLTPRSVWRAVGGLDEVFRVSLNDIDYCLRLADHGLRTVYAGGAELVHHESASRGRVQDPAELSSFRTRHHGRLDPYHSPNLDGDSPTPECRLDFAAFKEEPLRVSVTGSAWEAEVVREALAATASRRRIELVADCPDVVVAAGVMGHREVNAAAAAGRPVVWAHGGPLDMVWRQRRVARDEDAMYRRALQLAAWVVFGSGEALQRSRSWQIRENFAVNRVAIRRPSPASTLARDREQCRVVWAGEADAEADPWTFVRAFHRLADGLPLEASWIYRAERADQRPRVQRALIFDRRAGRRSGRRISPPMAGEAAALQGVDLFVSTGTGWDDPRPLLHATACGAAILAPYECGLGERAFVGVNAWTYTGQDDRSLALRLQTLILDAPLRRRLGQRSREVFGCLWSFEEMADRWADLVWAAWHQGPCGVRS